MTKTIPCVYIVRDGVIRKFSPDGGLKVTDAKFSYMENGRRRILDKRGNSWFRAFETFEEAREHVGGLVYDEAQKIEDAAKKREKMLTYLASASEAACPPCNSTGWEVK